MRKSSIRDVAIGDGRVAGVDRERPQRPGADASGADRHRRGRAAQRDRDRAGTVTASRRVRGDGRSARYFSDVAGMTSLGEMHVRRGHYIGVAPVPGGLTNACLVVPHDAATLPLAQPADALDRLLAGRSGVVRALCRRARRRAADHARTDGGGYDTRSGEPGLLLAGDAAGFIDPMTGDGLRFALVGAELAAAIVKEVFAGSLPIDRAHLELAERRRRRFNRSGGSIARLRALVASPASVTRRSSDGSRVAVALRRNHSLRG